MQAIKFSPDFMRVWSRNAKGETIAGAIGLEDPMARREIILMMVIAAFDTGHPVLVQQVDEPFAVEDKR